MKNISRKIRSLFEKSSAKTLKIQKQTFIERLLLYFQI